MTNKDVQTYSDVLNFFSKEKVEKRYISIYSQMESFIKRKSYEQNVVISESLLNQALLDYFTDIKRLKEFHNIENANYIKIHSYMAYWLLRRKPIQIVKEKNDDIELAFINEKFVASYILNFLWKDNENAIILEQDRDIYYEFILNLEYYLKYRFVTPQMLETTLEAYNAGMAFQRAKN